MKFTGIWAYLQPPKVARKADAKVAPRFPSEARSAMEGSPGSTPSNKLNAPRRRRGEPHPPSTARQRPGIPGSDHRPDALLPDLGRQPCPVVIPQPVPEDQEMVAFLANGCPFVSCYG
jgi:hypothetical protein